MGPIRSLLISGALLLAVAHANPEQPRLENPDAVPSQEQPGEAQDRVHVLPEPHTMLFTGIGGLILLLFVLRRK